MKISELIVEFTQVLGPGTQQDKTQPTNQQTAKAVGTTSQPVGKTASDAAKGQTTSGPQLAKQISNIKTNINNIKDVLKQTGGGNIDTAKLASALATQDPGKPMDAVSMKSLQSVVPALADTLKDPTASRSLKTALSKGFSQELDTEKKSGSFSISGTGSVGPNPANVGPK
jgi:hypothetical protein